LSYRRKVSWSVARAIFQDLKKHRYRAFMDLEGIGPGEFDLVIQQQIALSPHFLLLLAPGSTERFVEPADPLRREIELAIDLNRQIVPILIDDFEFKTYAAHLTGKLEMLPRLNGVRLNDEYFEESMTRLRNRFLKSPPKR
jgi:hypothetical protein